ncbi:4,5-dihydroxyphthalate dehydrogenase [Bordetella bronchialis]|uniref:4,5-dihydroxyphthalate dehydrogenase n=1 Tax=Bordetella bronchialis TaxID=463025 RepID=A0A193G4B4_9BORD|nr:4,5-dihydroxyphthalate dehydrogenase [Bordetella bronchialis]ANN74538.1 4,5-dihydroxyphthalate dehydrogenase [Bordetella bronchialis]
MLRRAHLLAAAATLGLLSGIAHAAETASQFPSHVIRFIVPYAAGGLPDTVARVVAQRVTASLGQSVVVENKPGANGVIAAQALMSSPRDGYTYLVTDGSMMSINPALYKDLSYDPKRDFVPVSLIATSPLFLATSTQTGITSLQDFVQRARAAPGKMNYGSSGVGSSHHLTMEALALGLHTKLTHVPFRGSGQSVPAMVGNQVDVVFAALPSLSGFAEKGQVRILATNAGKRSTLAPDIPAIAEILPGFNFAVTVGALAATGVPDYAVRKLSTEIAKAVQDPAVIKQFDTLGIEPVGGSPKEYALAIDDEARRYESAIKAANIRAE